MAKLILIDHSLRDQSGHHYPYAASVLHAAENAGMQVVLASHRDFRGGDELSPAWPLHPVFHVTSYADCTIDTQNANPSRTGAWRRGWRSLQRRRHAARFAADCARLFTRVPLAAGDIVFLATASELDLRGLCRYLQQAGAPAGVHWHLQIHFGIHRTRPDHYAEPAGRAAEAAIRTSLEDSLRLLPAHVRLHFHCTTDELAAQYNRLALARFSTLPYPVHARFSAAADVRSPGPLRIALLGHARREKGHGHLPALLQALWHDGLGDGRAQLLLQAPKPAVLAPLQAAAKRLGNGAAVVTAPGGLDLARYAQLVRDCDIGVLLYDGLRYFDRCSGILLELLAAGVPVVVPAASWLARQIAAREAEYLRDLQGELQRANRLRHLPMATPGAAPPADIQLTVPADCGALLLTARVPLGTAPAQHLCVDAGGDTPRRVAALPAPGETLRLLLALPGNVSTNETRLACSGLDGAAAPHLENLEIHAVSGAPPPLGALGLAVASPAEAAAGVRDILRHHAHYREQARAYAPGHAARQSGAAVIRQLVATCAP